MKCECPLAGYCSRRKCDIPEVHWKRCQSGQIDTVDRFYNHTQQVRAAEARSLGVGQALKQRIEKLLTIKSGGSCGCTTLASQMDSWGPDQCETRREYIVDRLVENKGMLVDALASEEGVVHKAIGWLSKTSVADAVLRQGANWLLSGAIEKSRASKVVVPRPQRPVVKPTRRVGGFGSFRASGTTRFVTSAQFQQDIKLLLAKIPPDVTAIAGVARSGLSAATMISMYLHLPMLTIRQTMNDIVPTGNGWRLGGNNHIAPEGKVLVVDDTCMTGNSIKAIRPLVESQLGNAIIATVYCNPLAVVKPDIWAVDLGWPHLLEWNLFNSILSPNMAVDFDGVLCWDCAPDQDDDGPRYLDWIKNAKPLYVPRRVPIPLIVTARIEKYRAPTEEWLDRHKIKFHNLVMHPASTLAERNRDDIAAYKARHYKAWASKHVPKPGPTIFCESDNRQARRIAELSGYMAICPHTAGVY